MCNATIGWVLLDILCDLRACFEKKHGSKNKCSVQIGELHFKPIIDLCILFWIRVFLKKFLCAYLVCTFKKIHDVALEILPMLKSYVQESWGF